MPTTHPTYITTPTDAGADVNYACPCGCYAGYAYQRHEANELPESCCCGRTMLVGNDAHARLVEMLPASETYGFDEQAVPMPWGEALAVALATPPDAEHGTHGEHDQDEHDHDVAHDHEGHGHGSH